jgi:long-subunit fatty acid transport protein
MKGIWTAALVLAGAGAAAAQDQQLGARTKAMGGSYTAFEDDPVSVWLNPAGISTQPDQLSIAYQTYTSYPLHREIDPGDDVVTFSGEAESVLVDPEFIPSYVGLVFHVGAPDSGMAVGVCYARPYYLDYSFDRVDDPAQTAFRADSNMKQAFSRFRAVFAKDWRLREPGDPGFLTHVSAGVGLDLGYARWQFSSETDKVSDNSTAFAGGLGALAGLYDNGESLRVNLGVAYQSFVKWDFNIDPDVFPAFDMPQQMNVGLTFYLLSGTPLRLTFDFQWIDWSETADTAFFPGHPEFEDAKNFSLGAEYKVPLGSGVSLYPRLGYRRFDAPWEDEDDMPMTSRYKLLVDTEGEAFNIFTFGAGLSWTTEASKVRSIDVAADAGGDASNLAIGFNLEF